MKNNNQKQCSGVWLDNHDAVIISNTRGNDGCYVVQERIKANNINDQGNELRERTNFFTSVSKFLLDYDEIFVFGPGKIHKLFQNYLKQDFLFDSKQITFQIADAHHICE